MTSARFLVCHCVDLCGRQSPLACLVNISSTKSLSLLPRTQEAKGLKLDSPKLQHKTILNIKINFTLCDYTESMNVMGVCSEPGHFEEQNDFKKNHDINHDLAKSKRKKSKAADVTWWEMLV